MTAKSVFYSFHFDNDVMRVQQVRNMGVVEGNAPVSPNDWEEVKKKGDTAIENWIDKNMKGKKCLIVLIGTETHKRPWVKYEIQNAWKDGLGVFGVHVHNLTCPNTGKCTKGANPLDIFSFTLDGKTVTPKVYDPPANDAYNNISTNMASWVDAAIRQRNP